MTNLYGHKELNNELNDPKILYLNNEHLSKHWKRYSHCIHLNEGDSAVQDRNKHTSLYSYK